jgi:hypothetical protein
MGAILALGPGEDPALLAAEGPRQGKLAADLTEDLRAHVIALKHWEFLGTGRQPGADNPRARHERPPPMYVEPIDEGLTTTPIADGGRAMAAETPSSAANRP